MVEESKPAHDFNDEVYELALPSIKELYGDMSVKELKGLSFEHMPTEVRNALQIAYSKLNQSEKIIPIGKLTLSEDGKTCSECHEELVVKTSTVSDSAGVRQRKILGCPKGCNSLTKATEQIKNENAELLRKGIESMKDAKTIFVKNTRSLSEKHAQRIMATNIENGFRCSPPNNQFTELTFATKIIGGTDEKLVKKTGKVISWNVCQHDLFRIVDKIESSEIYNLLMIEEIGNLCNISEFNEYHDGCFTCCSIGRNIEHELRKHDWYYETQRTDDRHDVIRYSKNKDVVYYRLTVQRIDEMIPKLILKVLNEKRFNNKEYDFLPSYAVTKLIEDKLQYLRIPDTLKSKVTSQLKSLYNKGLLEIEVDEHYFSDSRYEKVHKIEPRMDGQVATYLKNNDYVGQATTLNNYRAVDNNAIYLTKQILKELDDLKDLRKGYGKSRTDGSMREWNFDEAMYEREIWYQIRKSLGNNDMNSNSPIYNKKYGLLWNACLSGINRQRGNKRN